MIGCKSCTGFAVALALAVPVAGGCKSDKDASPQTEATQPSQVATEATEQPAAAGQPEAAGESAAAKLPDTFPSDFPMPDGLAITEGTFTEASATTQANYLVRATSSQSVSDLAGFYHQKLTEAGYKVQGQPPPADAQNAVVPFSNDSYRDASIQLSRAGDSTSVIISLPVRE